jgi:histidinol phosphatase-like enzyme
MIYGDHVINKKKDTSIDRAHRWKLLAENFQKKSHLLDILPEREEKGS